MATGNGELDSIIERVVRGVHDGTFGSGKISIELHNELLKLFKVSLKQYGKDQNSVDYGTPDYNTISALRNNLSAFSAAKTYSQIKAMNDLLVDENGNIRSFQDFRDRALMIHKDYNRSWLSTEYNTAVGNAQMAARWNDIQANEEATHITVYTAGDERVRDEHVGYDGFTRPKTDPIWKSFWPPFDWACRCYAIEGIDLDNTSDDPDTASIPPLFRNNAGDSGVVFKSGHPYFQNVDGSITAMRAVDNYGFKSMAKIYADTTKLPVFENVPRNEVWESMRALYPFKTDSVLYQHKDGYKSMLTKKVFDQATTVTLIHQVIEKSSETWLGSEGTLTHLKFYDTVVYMIRTTAKGKVIEMKSLQPDAAEDLRTGIPI